MVDIIVRARNGHELTAACVDSIRENTPRESYRLILVDDGSVPPYLATDGDVLVRHPESYGAVSATNSGLAQSLLYSDSEYVVVMDNDTRVPAGDTDWLERFVSEMEQYGPGCAAVGATSSFVNQPQHILYLPSTYTADWEDGDKGGVKTLPGAIWFVSFCVLLRKDAIRAVGLWDERYNPGNWEDTDYAVQLRVAGYTVNVARSVYIHHRGHQTFGDQIRKLLETNKAKFIEKWGAGRLYDLGLMSGQDLAKIASRRPA